MRVLNKKYWPAELQIRYGEPGTNSGYSGSGNSYTNERVVWCRENLPRDQWCAYGEGYNYTTVFAFKEITDITAFKLRWK